MAFEDILSQIDQETDRTALAEVAKKYPVVRNLAESGEKFQGLRTKILAVGVKEENVERALDQVPTMFQWTAENYDFEAGMTKQEKAKQARISELETEIEALRAGKETEMSIDEIMAALEAKGFGKAPADVITKKDLEAALMAQSGQFENVYAELTPLTTEHARRFNEAIPMRDVIKVMNEKGLSAKEAYATVIAPKEKALHDQEVQSQIAEAEKRGEQKGLEKAKEMVGRGGMPLDNGGGTRSGLSRFAAKILDRRQQGSGSGGRLGDGTAAAAGAAKLREKELTAGAA